jgi:hypothetical protein
MHMQSRVKNNSQPLLSTIPFKGIGIRSQRSIAVLDQIANRINALSRTHVQPAYWNQTPCSAIRLQVEIEVDAEFIDPRVQLASRFDCGL